MKVRYLIISDEVMCGDEVILKYRIEYPQIISVDCGGAEAINQYYAEIAAVYRRYVEEELYTYVKEGCILHKKDDTPAIPYEFFVTFQVTGSYGCILSLVFEEYTFMGGAHGSTIRYSDVWNVQTGAQIRMKELFIKDFLYRQYLIEQVIAQIAAQTAEDKAIYFENYRENVADKFNEESFYLVKDGMVVYFQQYDIAPYAGGIPEFYIAGDRWPYR